MMKRNILTTFLVVGGLLVSQAQISRHLQGQATKHNQTTKRKTSPATPVPAEPVTMPTKRTCGTMDLLREQQALGIMPSDAEFEQWLGEKRAEMKTARQSGGGQGLLAPQAVLRLPIIVHVIHSGQAIGVGTNLSAAQVQSQIDILNEDFRKKFGTPGYNTHPAGADMEIEFIPAVVDPNGVALAEPGIHRYQGTATSYSQATMNSTIKPATSWNPNKYVNIWTANLSGGILGYAQFPSNSTLTGLQTNGGATNTDGVVILHTAFGRVGNVAAPYNRGRTLTHELGHWLGLRHIWGDASCGTDYCNDTPTHLEANYSPGAGGCFTHPKSNSCGTADEMFENYMDYTEDVCMNIFTNDQKGRMATVMANSPGRKDLLTSTVGGIPVPCASIASPLPLNQNFEASFLPANWRVANPDLDSTWRKANVSGFSTGSTAVAINNFTTDSRGKLDILATPQHDFSTITGAVLEFDVAYSPFSLTNSDTLILTYSTDCGNTFTPFWKKGGSQLATTNGFSTTAFTPTATQWRTETVNLGSVAAMFGSGKTRIVIGLQNKSGYGNFMYLDNIKITAGSPVAALPVASFTASASNGCVGRTITYSDKSTNNPTSRLWKFEGGTPATSTAVNPTVTYSIKGTYKVELIATNTIGSDTIMQNSFITIDTLASQLTPIAVNFVEVDTLLYSIENPDNDTTWTVVDTVGSGISSSSLVIDNYGSDFAGKIDAVVLKKLKLPNTVQKLSFDVAYGFWGYDSTLTPIQAFADTLTILASADCGATYRKIWEKGGEQLATVPGRVKTAFKPNGKADWRREGVSLADSPLRNASSLELIFVNKSGYGNKLYLDSITVSTQASCPTAPILSSTVPTSLCAGSALPLNTNYAVAGATFLWKGPNGFTATVKNPTIPAATVAASGVYSLAVTYQGCTSATSTITITVNPAPVAPLASVSAATLCGNDTLRLMASTVANASYTWTGPNNFVSNEQNPKLVGLTTASAGTYSVRTIARGCTSSVATVSVLSISPAPSTITATGTASLCAGANISLSSTAISGATYTWTGPNGFTASIRNPSIPAATTAAAGVYSVFAQIGNCKSNTVNVTVNVRPTPNMPTITQVVDTLVCDTIANAYQWLSNSSVIPGATQRKFKPTVSGNYAVRISNTQSCTATSTLKAVVVTSIESDLKASGLSVFPNPSAGIFNIRLADAIQKASYEVYSVVGQKIISGNVVGSEAMLDLAGQSAGIYLLKLTTGTKVVTKQIVITK